MVKIGVETDAVEVVGVIWVEEMMVWPLVVGEGKLRSVVWAGVLTVVVRSRLLL